MVAGAFGLIKLGLYAKMDRIIKLENYVYMKKKIENIFSYRFLLRELVVKGIKLKYRDSYLGILWTMLEPLLTTAVLTIVFGSLYGRSPEFPLYVLTGRMFYGFCSHGYKGALKSIRGNLSMFKKVYVGNNCVIRNSVILNDVYIGDNTVIENCIVESRDTIRANCRYAGEDGKVRIVVEKNERYNM